MQNKITFESVLRECGLKQADLSFIWYIPHSGRGLSVEVFDYCCDVLYEGVSILNGYVHSPRRLRILLDILLETRPGSLDL